MRTYLILIYMMLQAIGCSVDKTIPLINVDELKVLEEFQNLDVENIVEIADEKETGEKLLLCLTILKKEDKTQLKEQRIKLFQANAKGEYEPSDSNDESTARLKGEGITDGKGRILVKTILPGDYGSRSDNRHIHTTIEVATPEAYDIHFLQYANKGLKNFIKRSDQHFLVELRYLENRTLIGFLIIEPKNIK